MILEDLHCCTRHTVHGTRCAGRGVGVEARGRGGLIRKSVVAACGVISVGVNMKTGARAALKGVGRAMNGWVDGIIVACGELLLVDAGRVVAVAVGRRGEKWAWRSVPLRGMPNTSRCSAWH